MGGRGTALVTGVANGIRAAIGLRSFENARIRRESSAEFVHSGPIDLRASTGCVPLRRFGRHEEVAGLMPFLARYRSSSITGTLILDNSGWPARSLDA